MKICSFICTCEKRNEFLNGFIYHYKRTNIDIPLYIFTDDKNKINGAKILKKVTLAPIYSTLAPGAI